ncbi:hypothetical protein Pyn_12953 [Prunus yedoensis var. nudiflora]|uniref:Uncharacterized protein n=1 Tax=Prunus yedoensis var. nudiflora TaxID=2094558 RepID=A0A314UXM7_PRUYE|nr:hypothetical protein Pyn_12953 [Prunus yedoensis var. nudiflora]
MGEVQLRQTFGTEKGSLPMRLGWEKFTKEDIVERNKEKGKVKTKLGFFVAIKEGLNYPENQPSFGADQALSSNLELTQATQSSSSVIFFFS